MYCSFYMIFQPKAILKLKKNNHCGHKTLTSWLFGLHIICEKDTLTRNTQYTRRYRHVVSSPEI